MSKDLSVNVTMQRRSATVNLTPWWASRVGLPAGATKCHVLGLFQVTDEDNLSYPAFVCELDDGQVTCASADDVTFTDTHKGVLL